MLFLSARRSRFSNFCDIFEFRESRAASSFEKGFGQKQSSPFDGRLSVLARLASGTLGNSNSFAREGEFEDNRRWRYSMLTVSLTTSANYRPVVATWTLGNRRSGPLVAGWEISRRHNNNVTDSRFYLVMISIKPSLSGRRNLRRFPSSQKSRCLLELEALRARGSLVRVLSLFRDYLYLEKVPQLLALPSASFTYFITHLIVVRGYT